MFDPLRTALDKIPWLDFDPEPDWYVNVETKMAVSTEDIRRKFDAWQTENECEVGALHTVPGALAFLNLHPPGEGHYDNEIPVRPRTGWERAEISAEFSSISKH